MNRSGRNEFFASRTKEPPPKHGIKIKKSGTTWWGQRWLEALERMSQGYSNRLARGRSYARAGRTHDLVVDSGNVTAKVMGSRPSAYEVTLRLEPLPDAVWQRAVQAMAEQAQFAAELLAGHMPRRIEEAFRGSGASLFPLVEADLVTECSCPDFANPCKHVAATHYVLGESLDRDPFLLFELRGRKKAQVLTALRLARAGAGGSQEGRVDASYDDRECAISSVTLDHLDAASYDAPREGLHGLELSFDAPTADAAVLRQLGVPAGWGDSEAPADLLAPVVRNAAARARRIALAETDLEAPLEAFGQVAIPRELSKPLAQSETAAAPQRAKKTRQTKRVQKKKVFR